MILGSLYGGMKVSWGCFWAWEAAASCRDDISGSHNTTVAPAERAAATLQAGAVLGMMIVAEVAALRAACASAAPWFPELHGSGRSLYRMSVYWHLSGADNCDL